MWISSNMDYHINCILIQDNFGVERQIQKSGRKKNEKKSYLVQSTHTLKTAYLKALKINSHCQMICLSLQVSFVVYF